MNIYCSQKCLYCGKYILYDMYLVESQPYHLHCYEKLHEVVDKKSVPISKKSVPISKKNRRLRLLPTIIRF